MPGINLMMLDKGTGQKIRCRFISEWFKIDFYVLGKEGLLSEIEKSNPDVVIMDLNLYAKIDGIETSRIIRTRFNHYHFLDKYHQAQRCHTGCRLEESLFFLMTPYNHDNSFCSCGYEQLRPGPPPSLSSPVLPVQ